MKNEQKIVALLGGEAIIGLMAGLPVNANGYFLSDAQMEALDAHVANHEGLAANQEILATSNQQLVTDLATSNNQLTTANARIKELEEMEGSASSTHKDADEFDDSKTVDPMAFDFQQEIFARLNG